MRYNLIGFISIGVALLSLGLMPAHAASKKDKAERLVRAATETINYFTNESTFSALWDTADDAKAIVVIPSSYRGGFVFGGAGGNALMIARNKDGSWSGPTFFTIGSFSFGFQAGGEVSEIILLVMTNRGKERLLSSTVKLGGDISIAAGPVGAGAKAQTADILAFARSRGLYGGLSVEGAVLKTRKSWNRAYYGADVTPAEVVFQGVADNPNSNALRQAAFRLSAKQGNSQASLQSPGSNTSQNTGVTNRASKPVEQEPIEYEDDAVYGAPLRESVRDQ